MGKLSVEMTTEDFAHNMQIFMNRAEKPVSKLITDAAVMFVQSAAKDVPASKEKKRRIVPVVMKFTNGKVSYRYDDESVDEGKGEYQRWGIEFKGKKARLRRLRAGLFETKREARRSPWTKIKYRGAGKAGFWLALKKIGASTPKSTVNRENLETLAGLNVVHNRCRKFPEPYIEVENHAQSIERYVGQATAWARTKVNNRMRYLSGMTREEIEREGGKIFNKQTRKWG